MTPTSFEVNSEVFPVFKLNVDNREYTVCFPVSAVIKAEETIGHSLKSLKDWIGLEIKHLGALLLAGLSKHHPDVSIDLVNQILDCLTPEAVDQVHYALCKLAFPKAMAAIEEQQQAKSKGEASPNAPSPDVA